MKLVYKIQMWLLQLVIFILLIECKHDKSQEESIWTCKDLDTALLIFKLSDQFSTLNRKIIIQHQYEICNQCDLLDLESFAPISGDFSTKNATIDSYYSYFYRVVARSDTQNEEILICDTFKYEEFEECGVYQMEINTTNCSISVIQKPNVNSNYYLILGAGIAVIFIIICNLIAAYGVRFKKWALSYKFVRIATEKIGVQYEDSLNNKVDQVQMNNYGNSQHTSLDSASNQSEQNAKANKKRLRSLDTFRGLSLFLMIFVNYGSGGYKSLQHVPWHGITLADFVFPWFLWIMGFSIPLSTNSLLSKPNVKRFAVFKKIFIRFAKMFIIGLMLNSRFGVKLENLRIFGVLQRIAICYFVVATIELILYKNINKELLQIFKKSIRYYLADLIWSWVHLVIMLVILLVWFLLTYLLPVPGCPIGYMGPGGLDQHSAYKNCTGGVAGYVDKILFGKTHLYQWPTPKKIYDTTEPFDPEGLFGVFNSIILTYMGVQAGRAVLFYKSQTHHVVLWAVWGLLSLLFYFGLTQFDMSNGWVPVNKNLWTFTYTLITASSSYLILIVFYFLIDIKGVWSGNPFIYLGMNSIVIYTCHSLFSTTLPCQWIVDNQHVSQLLMDLWGSIFWTLVAIYLYCKKIFVNL